MHLHLLELLTATPHSLRKFFAFRSFNSLQPVQLIEWTDTACLLIEITNVCCKSGSHSLTGCNIQGEGEERLEKVMREKERERERKR